jgi:uncharacterized membrane protein YkoI
MKMMRMSAMRLFIPSVFALAVLCGSSAQAQEKHLKKSDLPAAVQKTADEQSKGATVKGYSSETEDGKLLYELSLTVSGHSKDVAIAADGTVVEVEEQVDLDKLPAAVRDALKKKAGAGTIAKVESLTKKGTLVAYEAQVNTAGKKSEIQVGPDGKDLAHPE